MLPRIAPYLQWEGRHPGKPLPGINELPSPLCQFLTEPRERSGVIEEEAAFPINCILMDQQPSKEEEAVGIPAGSRFFKIAREQGSGDDGAPGTQSSAGGGTASSS